jgi:hypothetical protein
VRVHLRGIHKVNKTLATGEIKTYYYAWRGGPRISANPGTPDFMRFYTEAHASVRKPRAGTLMTLIAEFKGSADYARLAPSTVRAYASYISMIETEFGDCRLLRWPTRGCGESSRRGAIGSPQRRARQTTRGRPWPGSCRSRRIGA